MGENRYILPAVTLGCDAGQAQLSRPMAQV